MEIQPIDDFIEQLLIDKGITDIEPDIKTDLKEDMKTRLTDQINKAAIMQLNEEKADELTALLDDPNFTNEQLVDFMKDSGVDLAKVTLDTMLQFRSFYLGAGE